MHVWTNLLCDMAPFFCWPFGITLNKSFHRCFYNWLWYASYKVPQANFCFLVLESSIPLVKAPMKMVAADAPCVRICKGVWPVLLGPIDKHPIQTTIWGIYTAGHLSSEWDHAWTGWEPTQTKLGFKISQEVRHFLCNCIMLKQTTLKVNLHVLYLMLDSPQIHTHTSKDLFPLVSNYRKS